MPHRKTGQTLPRERPMRADSLEGKEPFRDGSRARPLWAARRWWRAQGRESMKTAAGVLGLLAGGSGGLADTSARPSPGGEPPPALRGGRATIEGHFDPQQRIRLAVGLSHPHPDEEEQL